MRAKKEISDDSKQKLTFVDLFFISFGGQAPFISLLTFGTVMIALVGTAGVFAMIIATLVVLFNGLVVYYLSKRFKRGGGYYTYAVYSLTTRLGLETGWSYILYAISYGGTLVTGGAYVLYYITGWNQTILALIVSVVASAIVLSGVRVSAKYAMIMSLIEMGAIVILSIYFLYSSGWHFYNPVNFPSKLASAVLFGLGIPTGYGSIAPLGEEADTRKSIGKAAILVLIFGGGLASLFFYSLGAINFTGNLVDYLLASFSIIGTVFLSFLALNDGILGGVSYILANSRTVKAMSEDLIFPKFLSKSVKNRPLISEIFIAIVFITILTLAVHYIGLYDTFVTLGALAGLGNIFIHTSANISLIRLASRRPRKHIDELMVGIIATIISLWVLVSSLFSVNPYVTNIFLGWLIFGFLYAEALDIVRGNVEEKEERR
ncbi:APC family permease [Sulfolobus acidocaldarius]|uniref:Conserved transporter protein n=4 Tax=Sulfolobus acidocaldarius TaxID=2285 RepID=Q4J7U7_SULAC|nr:APC family permease [Sulfolobus acidocaldarius]AAY81134.1 conserved transporter protein [Sulfolobus acidocaldarius DSM 639]AGE71744.1 transporter protein [Sulfolobus acidocaldarius N8]AGE74017.1 transporter protein [Sulfolobus acidocaldarius Ron12/I]ALU30053.1 amino acid permease [Sulfolobus acidocaldarius]ALU30743.1 amino acid permease [Sulfolobus acidocaldarius]